MDIKDDYTELLNNNRKWVAQRLAADPEFFAKLSKGQQPKFLWIGCSDSRVPANEITGTDPGEMFVHRNIANMVVHTDINMLSVLDYAVKVLKVEHVIVCGHYDCGGVLTALSQKHLGLIDNWLRNIKDVYRLHQQELDSIDDPTEKARLFVELNVIEQVYNLCKTSTVQEAWDNEQQLQVHGWVYDISNGLVNDLDVTVGGYDDMPAIYKFDFK